MLNKHTSEIKMWSLTCTLLLHLRFIWYLWTNIKETYEEHVLILLTFSQTTYL